MLVTGSPIGSMATVRTPGSARQSGTVAGANAIEIAKNAPPNFLRSDDSEPGVRSPALNTRGLAIPAKHIFHGIDNLAECGANPRRIHDQLHQVCISTRTVT